ncbi:PLP-dependent aminotransferase family protein [Staphylococcus lutrae]|uniref:GntR family transcriptional regulator n=1 Tax=Staphylococcus lutrae TaxID=155085 RepID=A0AAC9WMJ7_9STAP|nr:PLP-dependent aminotransferase family protein [Staphylococcus lutrae]ARJ51062.1 GntR family transcriptional regulator [Staphylococcus lutrae]PNZ38312.1 PLP-dependent aminotransferase family protein [Staphylococcus lutrae]
MEMLMFHIDKSLAQPIYLQLYENIKQSIIKGQMHEGEKLPSKRQLSQYLSVSQTTVESAYAQLVDEGYIYSRAKSGFFVSDIDTLPFTQSVELESLSQVHPPFPNLTYAFKLGTIDQHHFPFEQFRKYAKEAFEELQFHLIEPGHKQGDLALRTQISHYLFHSRGVQSTPEQVIVASSTEQLLSMITDLLPDTKKFILEDPIYPQVHQVLKRKHIPYHFIPVEKEGIVIEDTSHQSHHIVYITPSHQFPTGVTMHLKNRMRLLKWATAQPHRFIIEDDYDSEFRYEGKPIPALQSLDQAGRVIYVSTFSKSISPTIRIAYAVLPKPLLSLYQRTTHIEGGTVPRHTQYMVARFMETNQFERHLNRMRKIYRQKRDIILTQLMRYPHVFDVSGEKTGMHFIITIKNGWSEKTCLERLTHFEIDMKPLSHYLYHNKQVQPPRFVLGFGGIPICELDQHIAQLIRCFTSNDFQ